VNLPCLHLKELLKGLKSVKVSIEELAHGSKTTFNILNLFYPMVVLATDSTNKIPQNFHKNSLRFNYEELL